MNAVERLCCICYFINVIDSEDLAEIQLKKSLEGGE